MLRNYRFLLILSLAVCLRAGADCFPVWGNAPYVSIAMTDALNARIVAADFNGDGKSDLGTTSRTELFVALMGANGQPGPATKIGTGDNLLSLESADVNGDGKVDLVLNDSVRSAIVVFPGVGDGSFGPGIESNVPVTPHEMVTGDFNGDAKVDVAFASDNGFVGILAGNGTGTFAGAAGHFATPAVRFLTAGDFDGDGKLDLLGRRSDLKTLRYFRGAANGTFSTAADVTGGGQNFPIDAADLDADGDLDIVTGDSQLLRMSVLLNQGGGVYAAPVTYPLLHSPFDIELLDVTGDGIPDAVVLLTNRSAIATYPGKGDGTFAAAVHSIPTYFPVNTSAPRAGSPISVIQADVDGDGATDDLMGYLAAARVFGTLTNQCGAVKITPVFAPPLVSVGQESALSVTVAAPGFTTGTAPAKPSGEVTLFEGETELASATLTDGAVEFPVPGDLPAGTHTFRIVYAGDDHYGAAESATTFRVTTVTTRLEVVIENPTDTYPADIGFTATATASDGSTPSSSLIAVYRNGSLWTRINGIHGGRMQSALGNEIPPGEYDFQFQYEGNSEHPPSPLTEPVHVTIVKGESNVALHLPLDPFRAGEPQVVAVSSNGSGPVSLYDGTTLVATMTTSVQGWAVFEGVTFQTTGAHTLIARRHESDTYHASEASEEVRVFVTGAAAIDVTSAGGAIQVWFVIAPNTMRKLDRLIGGAWTEWPLDGNPATIANPAPGVPYIFRIRLYNWPEGALVATSNVDGAMVTRFTDEALTAGTKIKALHFTQLLGGINAWRNAAALPPLAIPNLAAPNVIRAADVNTMQNGLNQARSAAGMALVPFGTVTAKQTKIKAVDLQQLRDLLVR